MLYPLQFRPVFREYIWGGRRLGDVLGKPIGDGPRYAESWEVVDHGNDQSVVARGPLEGKTLGEVLREAPTGLLGSDAPREQFPLLLKYLDCNRVLSVQVHPDDEYGQRMSPPDFGKTEAWYIISAEPGSLIYAGLKEGVGPKELRDACKRGCSDEVLHTLEPSAGDCVFIPAGTMHALGEGLLVAEIQQSSDTTFRLFDWNRVDDQGNSRPLHIEQAIEVTDYARGPVDFQTPQKIPGSSGERLVECDKFVLDRFCGARPFDVGGDERFHILTVVSGAASLKTAEGFSLNLALGETTLLPAVTGQVEIEGVSDDTTVLRMCLPHAQAI